MDDIKQVIYAEVGLNHLLKAPVLNTNIENADSSTFNILTFLFLTLYEWSWYASDFLYWIIYFGAYIHMHDLLGEKENLPKSPISLSPHAHRKNNILNVIKEPLFCLAKIFEDVGAFFSLYLQATPLWLVLDFFDGKLRLLKCYAFLKLLLNFKTIFRILGCVCVFGGISKLYINVSWLFHLINNMIINEDNFKAKYGYGA